MADQDFPTQPHGMAITQYCDKLKLDINQRIELFLKVCEGRMSLSNGPETETEQPQGQHPA